MNLDQMTHEGKEVFVGIDVHKKTYAICVRANHLRTVLKITNLKADPMGLALRLKKSFPGAKIKTVYEAGFAGFKLHRILSSEGIENIVVNPASIEVAANNKVKTDKRDAAKMAEHLMMGRLRGIRIPSEQEELSRLYTRTRQQLVEHRTAIGNQIKSKLMQFGYLGPDDTVVMSLKLLKTFETMNLPLELAFAIGALGETYKCLSKQIKNLEKMMAEQASREQELEMIYRSVPGFGAISSRIFASELGDMKQFNSEKALFAFMGMTPSEHSSGDKEYRGSITRQGRSILRFVITEVAWRAIRKDPALEKIYLDIKLRRGGKKAIVAVGRRLVARVRACLAKGEVYELGLCQS